MSCASYVCQLRPTNDPDFSLIKYNSTYRNLRTIPLNFLRIKLRLLQEVVQVALLAAG